MSSKTSSQTYRNALEPLIEQEVQRQVRTLPPQVLQGVVLDDIIAYALNCLPPLYATTQEGWQWQQARAKQELQSQITSAVQQGLMVVHQSPQRNDGRLLGSDKGLFEAQEALVQLSSLLNRPRLSWPELVSIVQRMSAIAEQNAQLSTSEL